VRPLFSSRGFCVALTMTSSRPFSDGSLEAFFADETCFTLLVMMIRVAELGGWVKRPEGSVSGADGDAE
jgi:hypothetical protein